MRRIPTLLARLLIVLLFWQAGTAAAHCLSRATPTLAMELCGPDGLRQVPLTDDTAPQAEAVCAICHLLPAAVLAAPDGLPQPVAWTVAVSPRPPSAPPGRLLERVPPYRPTGPPALA